MTTKAIVAGIAVAAVLVGGGVAYTVSQKQAAEQAAAAKAAADAQLAAAKAAADAAVAAAKQAADQAAAAAAEKARELAMPDLPVKVSTRKAMMGAGLVAIIRNFGSKELPLAVTASSSATGQSKKFQIVVPPGGAAEIGHKEGWPFSSGDELLIAENGFRPQKVTIK